MVYAATFDADDQVESYQIDVKEWDAYIWVQTRDKEIYPHFRYRDAINGITSLVLQALADKKFQEVVAAVLWRLEDSVIQLGRIWIYAKRPDDNLSLSPVAQLMR